MVTNRWSNHFLRLALCHARMSKDPSTRVGSILVAPDRSILGAGFNGFPRNIKDHPRRLADRETKLKLIVHAEMNAFLAAAKLGIPINGAAIYIIAQDVVSGKIWGGPPCTRCTTALIQAGVESVITLPFQGVPARWKDDLELAKDLLNEAGIIYNELEGFVP